MENKEAAETLRNLASGANPYFMAQIRAKGNLFKLCLQAAEALEIGAEITRLTAENERLKKERDKAIKDIPHKCWKCKHVHCGVGNECELAHYTGYSEDCINWQWRGEKGESQC
jgi:hypothetical protein